MGFGDLVAEQLFAVEMLCAVQARARENGAGFIRHRSCSSGMLMHTSQDCVPPFLNVNRILQFSSMGGGKLNPLFCCSTEEHQWI